MIFAHPIILEATSTAKPLIGYQNLLTLGTVTSSGDADEYPAAYAYDWKPWTYWKAAAAGSAWIAVALPLARVVDYFAVHSHTLSENGATITLQYSTNDGASWLDAVAVVPGNSRTVFRTFAPIAANRWRVLVSSPGAASLIGCVSFGKALRLERGCKGNFNPPATARDTEVTNSTADNGTWLGRSIVRNGLRSAINLVYVTPGWVRESWLPFMEHAERRPFFLQWSPGSFPDDVAFMWSDGDIERPAFMHPSYMKCGIQMKGQRE